MCRGVVIRIAVHARGSGRNLAECCLIAGFSDAGAIRAELIVGARARRTIVLMAMNGNAVFLKQMEPEERGIRASVGCDPAT